MTRRGPIGWILNTIIGKQLIIRPVFNILIIFLALFNGNLGLAIIVITLIFRLILIKFTSASNQMAHGMSELQPKIDEIQEKYKDNPNKMAEETMKLWKTEGKSPMKGCLRLLIQLPIIGGLYWVIYCMANGQIDPDWLYSFFYSFGYQFLPDISEVSENINTTFLGLDLLGTKNIILAVLTGGLMFIQMKLTTLVQPKQKAQKMPNGQDMPDMTKMMGGMSGFMSIFMGFFVYILQSALGLYMVVSTLFSICQYTRQYRSLLHAKRQEMRGKPSIVKG